ncbi:uncharacterized protein LOC124623141 [Schistocerca americana]|nr:uncharacterized protein LOC124623141 [Schistocerca americana]
MLKHTAQAQGPPTATNTTSSGTPASLLLQQAAAALRAAHHHHHHQHQHHHAHPAANLSLNLSQRLNHSHLSTLSTSKHSLGNASSVSPGGGGGIVVANGGPGSTAALPKMANGGLHISRSSAHHTQGAHTISGRHHTSGHASPTGGSRFSWRSYYHGQLGPPREALGSLGLLCLASLLLALLSLIFLLRLAPLPAGEPPSDEYVLVHDATLALCALALSLNLCCLLVCAVQVLFAVRLVRSPHGAERTNKYLQKSSITRMCAVSGFFISIPVFLTGIILYTFIQFHSTPAIITSVFIGVGIVFCGCAMVHNVFVWQREKTNAVRALALQQQQQHQHQPSLRQPTSPTPSVDLSKVASGLPREASGSVSPGVPVATLDLSTAVSPHELSTLV